MLDCAVQCLGWPCLHGSRSQGEKEEEGAVVAVADVASKDAEEGATDVKYVIGKP